MTSYRVQHRPQGDPAWTDGPTVDTGSQHSGEALVTGLTNGVVYEFRVVRTDNGVVSRNIISATPSVAFESNLDGVEASVNSGGDALQVGTFDGVRGALVSLANNGNTFTVEFDNGGGWAVFGSKAGGNRLTGGTSQGSRSFFFPFPSDVTGIIAVRAVITRNGGSSNTLAVSMT
jgi:hypothetical protein